MTLIGLSAFTMVTIVGLAVEANAQTPCSELARLRSEAAEDDESAGIGALRIIHSFLLGREGDGRVRK
jgi:hypothetical protein